MLHYMGSTPANNFSNRSSFTLFLQSFTFGSTILQPLLSVSSSSMAAFFFASSTSVAHMTKVLR